MFRKIILQSLVVSLLFFFSTIIVNGSQEVDTFPNWDFYPSGINYLHHNHYNIYHGEDERIYSSGYFLKVKPNTTYHLQVYRTDLVEFRYLIITFFNEQKERLDNIYIAPDKYYFTFDTLEEVYYIKLNIRLGLTKHYQKELKIDELLFLYEGEKIDEQTLMTEDVSYKGPLIEGSVYTASQKIEIIKEFDQQLLLSEILQIIKAYDDLDGDISNKIMVEVDNYSDNQHVIGSYDIILSVRDSSYNFSKLTINITNVDTTSPIISGINFYEISCEDNLTLEEIISNVSAYDNYDQEISEKIEVVSDNYSRNKGKLGTFKVVLGVSDSSNNLSYFDVNIKISDNQPPVILGPQTIRKSIQEVLTLDDIKSYFIAIDNYDGNITNQIAIDYDEYSHNMHRYGMHEICFVVSDSSGNIQYFSTYIENIDDIAPVFVIDQTMINLTLNNKPIQINEVINMLAQSNKIKNPHDVIILEDEYTTNNMNPGQYKVVLQEDDEIIEVVINLKDDQNINNHQQQNISSKKQSKVLSFIKKLLDNVKKIFRKK